MLRWALLTAILVLIALISVALALFTLARHRLLRRHRINPSTPTSAPLHWMASPQAAARMHRRLCRAADAAHEAVDRTTPKKKLGRKAQASNLAPLVFELEQEALAIDEHLTLVQRLSAPERRRLVAHLDVQVRQVEGLAGRIAMLSARSASPVERVDDPPVLHELEAQVDALEAGRIELEALQRDAGLVTASRLPQEVAASRPVAGAELHRPG